MAPTNDYPATNTWLMAEDETLKKLLSDLSVPGQAKKVPVYFRFPESERQISYPFITIDLIGVEPAYDLWTSVFFLEEDDFIFEDRATGAPVRTGLYEPSVAPSVFDVGPLDPTMPVRRMNYLAYRLFYQVTTWSKTFAHDRALTSTLIRDIFHPRPSWAYCEVDQTWRRLEPLGWQPADIPTQEGATKRIFRKAFTLSMQSEVPQDRLNYLEQSVEVRRLAMRGFYQQSPDEYWTDDESHIEPGDVAWEVLHDEDTP